MNTDDFYLLSCTLSFLIKLDYNKYMMKFNLFYKLILILILLITGCELAANSSEEVIYFYVPKSEVITHSYAIVDDDKEMVDCGIKTYDPIDGNNYSYMMQLYNIDPDNTVYRMIPNVNVDTVIIERRLP